MLTETTGTFKPLRDGILVSNMEFGEQRTEGGIIIMSDDGKFLWFKDWGKVFAVGLMTIRLIQDWTVCKFTGRWSLWF